MYNLIKCSLQYGRDQDMHWDEMVHPPERPWKWFSPLYQKDCVEGNMVQERSGRVSLARTVLCWAHITFKHLLRRLRMKSLVTIASHTNSSLHVCRFSSEPRKTDGCSPRRINTHGRVLTQTFFGLPRVGTERVNKPKTVVVHSALVTCFLVGVFMA